MGCQRLIAASIALAGLACRERGATIPDAATDGIKSEGSSALTLVIAVTGCAPYEPAGNCGPDGGPAPCCRGAPPLTLSFAPVGSPELTSFKWTFGDDEAAMTTDRAPTHVYAYPGTYEVTLTGNGDIGMPPPDLLYVVVESLPAGAPCDVKDQCEDGLTCLCAPGSGCSPAFTRGFCSMACDTAMCGVNAVCAAPPLGAPAGAGAPAALCLAGCAQCAPGYVCQTLPAGSTTAATPWTRGCLPLGAARDLGGPCRDANDVLSNDTCATRQCADVGALGVCSASCDDSHPCPDEAACTQLADGRQLCLATCTVGVDCDRDPLLACAPSEMSAGPSVTVCAPRRCTGDAACAPSGRCGPDGVCVRK